MYDLKSTFSELKKNLYLSLKLRVGGVPLNYFRHSFLSVGADDDIEL